jgi:hypothetical protein
MSVFAEFGGNHQPADHQECRDPQDQKNHYTD